MSPSPPENPGDATGEKDAAPAPTGAEAAPDPAAAQAVIDKAVAEALKAKADADKAAADARSARAKAGKDERDAAWSDTVLAQQQREAEARKATAEADKATAAAKREEIAALIPDFSKVDRGSLTLKGDQPLFAHPLAQRALDAAADSLVATAVDMLPESGIWRILVTSDGELAASHAVYIDVVTGLDQLRETAEKLIEKVSREETEEFVPLLPAIGALAGAVPGLLSLFSAHRTVTTTAATIEDLAAAAAVAGALKRREPSGSVVHDDFRLLATGTVHRKLAVLTEKREELVGHRIALEAEKTKASSELTEAREKVEELTAELEAAAADAKPGLRAKLAEAQHAVPPLEQAVGAATVKLGLIASVQSAIDSFVASLTAVPEGAKRSPLALAAMREHLHDVPGPPEEAEKDPSAFTYVLLVKGNGGSVQQTIDDKWLWREDTYAVVATANITYMLLETLGSGIVAAGNIGGSAAASGSIGDEFEIEVRSRPFDEPASDSF